MPTWLSKCGCSSQYSRRIRSPSLPLRSSGVRMKKISPPPVANALALLGHLADVPEERVDGMRNGGRQRPVRIAFERRPMETSKFHLRQMGRDERSLQFHHGRRMLNDIATGVE